MIIPDVNILVGALRHDDPRHATLSTWLTDAVASPEPLGLPMVVLAGAVRVVTHPKVFRDPTPLASVLADLDRLIAEPGVVTLGEARWSTLSRLCEQADARGNLVPDAHIAAIAIDHGATLVTLDHGFARFPGLTWCAPDANG